MVNTKVTIIADRYELVREIGRGEFGVVYEACDILLGRSRVALKMFPGSVASDERAAAQFGREVLAMTRIDHPNVERFFDIVRDVNRIGYSMEYIPGVSLASLAERGPRLTIEEIRSVLVQICRGAEAIHRQKVIHRDLKPENVIIDHTGRCKIVDFGVAQLLGIRTQLFSGDRHGGPCLAGTLDYMSPELLQEAEPGEGSDVYAIGVIGYFLIAGRVPFAEFPLEAALWKKTTEEPTPPAALDTSCPNDLSSVISTAVAREPGERYSSPRALRVALEQLDLKGEVEAFPPTTCLGMRVSAFRTYPAWLKGRGEQFGNRRPVQGQGVFLLLGVITFVTVAVAAVIVAPHRSPTLLWPSAWASARAGLEAAVMRR
jgi:serine/threonine protein kinase